MPRLGDGPTAFVTQKPIDFIDTALTINVWEEVSADLSAGKPCKLVYIILEQTNNGATDETIELEVTINGTAYMFTASLTSGTPYYGYFTIALTAGDLTPALSTSSASLGGFGLMTTSTNREFTAEKVGLIRVRQTTDVDVVSAQIEVNIVWEKRKAL